jgi:hypothetical protein
LQVVTLPQVFPPQSYMHLFWCICATCPAVKFNFHLIHLSVTESLHSRLLCCPFSLLTNNTSPTFATTN